MMMCWETACDQTVVGDHALWIDDQTVDAVARKRGDDVQRTAEVVRMLRSQGIPADKLYIIFRRIVVAYILYAMPARGPH